MKGYKNVWNYSTQPLKLSILLISRKSHLCHNHPQLEFTIHYMARELTLKLLQRWPLVTIVGNLLFYGACPVGNSLGHSNCVACSCICSPYLPPLQGACSQGGTSNSCVLVTATSELWVMHHRLEILWLIIWFHLLKWGKGNKKEIIDFESLNCNKCITV